MATQVKDELTGRRRYRQSFGLGGVQVLILQVEIAVYRIIHEWDKKTGLNNETWRWVCEWRDARPEDVSADQLV